MQNSQISFTKFSNFIPAFLPDTPFRHPERANASCHPDRARRVEGSVVSASLSPKEEWKNAHADKNAFAAFSIPLFLPLLFSGLRSE